MRTSATGNNASEAGFTLVEMLVAITILALMTGVVMLTLPPSDGGLRAEAERLAARLEMAGQQSVIGGRPMGFSLSSQGYAFQRYEDGAWVELARDPVFAPHAWAEETFVAFEQSRFFAPAEIGEEVPAPLIRFGAAGLPARFVISLSRREATLTLRADSAGRIEVTDG